MAQAMKPERVLTDKDVREAIMLTDRKYVPGVSNQTWAYLFARRIESLVRKRLAERLRAEADRVSTYALSQAAGTLDRAARLVESDGGADV